MNNTGYIIEEQYKNYRMPHNFSSLFILLLLFN